MVKFVFSLLFMMFSNVYSFAGNRPITLSDGFLGIAFDGVLSASEVFLMFVIGAYISYKLAMYLVNRQLAKFTPQESKLRTAVSLIEIYLKAAVIPAVYGIFVNSALKLDRSFVLYEYCNEYVLVTTIGTLFLVFAYTLLLPNHKELDILRMHKTDAVKLYDSFSRIFISTTCLYCFLSLANKMGGIDYLMVDIICRSIAALHYVYEILSLKHVIHAFAKFRKIAYVGHIALFVRYINQRVFWIACFTVLMTYAYDISSKDACFVDFVGHVAVVVAVLCTTQILSIHLLEFATSKSLAINRIDVVGMAGKFKRHIYETANVAISIMYVAMFYMLTAYIFADPKEFVSDISMLYVTIKAVVQIYLVFFLYKCIDLFLSYKTEVLYAEKSGRAKTLRSILPAITVAVKFIIIGIGIMVVLANYGVNLSPLYAAIVGLGIPIANSAKETVKSFIQGFMMLLDDDMEIGDVVHAGGVLGVIEHIGVWSMKIRENTGIVHVVPYSSVSVISNYSRDFTTHFMDIYCPNTIDVDMFIGILHEVCNDLYKNEKIAHLLFKNKGFNYVRIKDFDELGTTLRWSYSSKPEPTGLIESAFNTILREKLTARSICYPRCMAKNVNIAWSAYIQD